jgi:hypothetical protein
MFLDLAPVSGEKRRSILFNLGPECIRIKLFLITDTKERVLLNKANLCLVI